MSGRESSGGNVRVGFFFGWEMTGGRGDCLEGNCPCGEVVRGEIVRENCPGGNLPGIVQADPDQVETIKDVKPPLILSLS